MDQIIPSLEMDNLFKIELLDAISKAEKTLIKPFSGYRKLINNRGSFGAASYLLNKPDLDSFHVLCKTGFKDCTMESFIVSEKYSKFFTSKQLAIAQNRLDEFK